MKKNLLKYIACGIAAAALFLTAFAFLGSLIHPERSFADGFRSIIDWILAAVFGFSCGSGLWKRDSRKNGEK